MTQTSNKSSREEREAAEKADAPDCDREDSESWAKRPDHSRTCPVRCLQARVRGDGFPEPIPLPCLGAEAPRVFCGLLSLFLVPVSGRVQSRETGPGKPHTHPSADGGNGPPLCQLRLETLNFPSEPSLLDGSPVHEGHSERLAFVDGDSGVACYSEVLSSAVASECGPR